MSKEVLVVEKRNELYTTSDIVAEGTKTEHKSLRKMIRKYKTQIEEFGKLSGTQLAESTGGRRSEFYYLNEHQTTFLITLLRNNDVVVGFKVKLIKEFYRMRQALLERSTIQWQEQRAIGKLSRKAETDVLKKLVEYAKSQGSSNADKLYMTYSSLVKKLVGGYSKRENATQAQLTALTTMEEMILHCVTDAMGAGLPYKEIYQVCKRKLQAYIELTYFERKAIL